MTKKLTPMKARTDGQICKLTRDNAELNDWCIVIGEGLVWITEQELGKSPTQEIDIPRAVFDRLVRWYVTGSKCGRLA